MKEKKADQFKAVVIETLYEILFEFASTSLEINKKTFSSKKTLCENEKIIMKKYAKLSDKFRFTDISQVCLYYFGRQVKAVERFQDLIMDNIDPETCFELHEYINENQGEYLDVTGAMDLIIETISKADEEKITIWEYLFNQLKEEVLYEIKMG